MTRRRRRLLLLVVTTPLLLILTAASAFADNCSGYSDCYSAGEAANDAVFGLILLGASLLIDLSPLGRVRGVIEAGVGKDLLTGQQLSTGERLLGLVPGGRSTRAVDSVSGARRSVTGSSPPTPSPPRSSGGTSIGAGAGKSGPTEATGTHASRAESDGPLQRDGGDSGKPPADPPRTATSSPDPDDEALRAEAERLRQLGEDPATKGFRQQETETASRIEREKGVRLERSRDPAVDWVDADGKTWDAVGPFESQYFDEQWPNLQTRILDHLAKADYVPIDVTRFTPEQVEVVRRFIQTLGPESSPRVFLIGL